MADDTAGFIEKYIRPDLKLVGGYGAHQSPDTLTESARLDIVKLDANENPYGCSPEVTKILGEYRGWHIYPDAAQWRLREKLAKYIGVPAECLVASTGSGELLNDILTLFLQAGDELINFTPTFDLYRLRTLINGGKLVNISRRDDFSADISAALAAVNSKTRMIVLCNPNNPTGNVTPSEEIIALLETGLPVLIDEAYYEFCGQTVVELMPKYPNLMVLRTFSKWAGLAGIRIGYGIFNPAIAAYLMKIKLPYNLSVPAAIAAEVSLDDAPRLMKNVQAIISERKRFLGELKSMEWLETFPSGANYLLCRILWGSAKNLYDRLLERGIIVRCFTQPELERCFRVSVGTPEQNNRFMEELKKLEAVL
ncbi:histidinol-phosphate transaminase [Chloroflexota bacterium]